MSDEGGDRPRHGRARIEMTDEEVRAYLDEARTMTCATNGPRGLPHLAPLWFVREETAAGEPLRLAAWTYGASQKVVNLRRDPRATLQVESGEEYDELAGVVLECDVRIVEDTAEVLDVGMAIAARYAGAAPPREALAGQAAKRVALVFDETHRTSWDHAKM